MIISDWKREECFNIAYERAKEGGLPVEFLMDFIHHIKNGDDVFEACRCALHEWDL